MLTPALTKACCAFECLRIVNYLSNASIEVVQTLLILGNVLSNAMNAGAAWVLLGERRVAMYQFLDVWLMVRRHDTSSGTHSWLSYSVRACDAVFVEPFGK